MSQKKLLYSVTVAAFLFLQSGLGHASVLTEDTVASAAAFHNPADWRITLPVIVYSGADARLTLVATAGQLLPSVDNGAVRIGGVALAPAERLGSDTGVSYDIRRFLIQGLNTLNLTLDANLFRDLRTLSFVISTTGAPPATDTGSSTGNANSGGTDTGSNTGNTSGGTTNQPQNPSTPIHVTPVNTNPPANDPPIPNPEPGTMILLGSGLSGLLAMARKARKA